MVLDDEWLNEEIKKAVSSFWKTRKGGSGVRGGKTLHAFLPIIEHVVKQNGLPHAQVHIDSRSAQLPGYFRPHKSWDAVVIAEGRLVAAIELKSQVGSIGNNFNNRTEEVLGSGVDLMFAIEEDAFGPEADIFTGYLAVVEKSESTFLAKTVKGKQIMKKAAGTLVTPSINMRHFPVMEGFLLNEEDRGSKYIKTAKGFPKATGISYLSRYDVMCQRLMLKKLYTAAAVIAAPIEGMESGDFTYVSPETSVQLFMSKLANHCQIASKLIGMKRQAVLPPEDQMGLDLIPN